MGSGDGRNVIAAAKRGARALGVEYNADLVELSRRRAREARDCSSWCTSMLHIVPAQVAGTWQLPFGELTLTQQARMLSGTLSSVDRSTALENGRMRGDEITFTVAGLKYTGRVSGDRMEGSTGSNGGRPIWTAIRNR